MLRYGDKLAAIRALLGLRQADIANGIGIHRLTYLFLENNRALPTPEQKENLNNFLGCDLDDPELTIQLQKIVEAHREARENLPQAA